MKNTLSHWLRVSVTEEHEGSRRNDKAVLLSGKKYAQMENLGGSAKQY